MAVATRESVMAYMQKTYGFRPEKVRALLGEEKIGAILHDAMRCVGSNDYYIAGLIVDHLTDEQRIPDEDSEEYEEWVDPNWAPSEVAVLEAGEVAEGEEEAGDEDVVKPDDREIPDEDDEEELDDDWDEDEDEDDEDDDDDDDDWEEDEDEEDEPDEDEPDAGDGEIKAVIHSNI